MVHADMPPITQPIFTSSPFSTGFGLATATMNDLFNSTSHRSIFVLPPSSQVSVKIAAPAVFGAPAVDVAVDPIFWSPVSKPLPTALDALRHDHESVIGAPTSATFGAHESSATISCALGGLLSGCCGLQALPSQPDRHVCTDCSLHALLR
jgi:hypothetical protein